MQPYNILEMTMQSKQKKKNNFRFYATLYVSQMEKS